MRGASSCSIGDLDSANPPLPVGADSGSSLAVPVVQSSDGTVVGATGVVVPSLKRDRQRLLGALQVAARGIGHLL